MKVTQTKLTIGVHENYVQTCVRFYGETSLTYVEYSFFGAKFPLAFFKNETAESMFDRANVSESEIQERKYIYLENFENRHVSIEIVFPDIKNHNSNFVVTEARYIEPHRGGRDFKTAFNEQMKRTLLTALLSCIADKDMTKLIGLIGTLQTIGE